MPSVCTGRRGEKKVATRLSFLLFGLALLVSRSAFSTSVIPISDRELHARADVVVHGIVLSSDVTVDAQGRPETLTIIEPISVLKGRLEGSLVLHQLGGELPDGTFIKMWGRPEYLPGREVVVFAVSHNDGEYETAEMFLGKFEIQQDEAGNRFAISDLAAEAHPGVDVLRELDGDDSSDDMPVRGKRAHRLVRGAATIGEALSARPLDLFLDSLRRGVFQTGSAANVVGMMKPVEHAQAMAHGKKPLWGYINNSLYRWTNNATAAFTLVGTANMTGGGTSEATAALAAWTDEPNSAINYTLGSGTGNTIDLNAAASSGCGWSTCLAGAGVIGCGGPSGGGSNTFRGDTYSTISSGFVQLRCMATPNLFASATIQSVLEHELGHTLGLGHSDQNVSPHDTCRGDEGAAIMRSTVQSTTPLGTDDTDAVRWLYGDGGNSCTSTALAVTSLTASPALPQPSGVSITWTANTTGGTAPLQFQFWRLRSSTGVWSMVQNYSASNTFTWTPAASETGQYAIQVWARNAGSTAAYDSYNGTPYFTITSSALAVPSLTASPALPQSYGVPITWTANTTGGTAPLQFQFWRLRSSTGVWSMVQNYSASNTFTWTPAASETGQYAIQVWVRNAGSTATYDAYNGTPYFSITGSAPTVSALTASPALPQRAGTTITWTATATGGTGPLTYQFWRLRSSTGAWTMVQNYSASNTFTWTPTASETDQYALQVWVRNAGSVAAYDAYNGTPYFTITP